MDSKVVNLKVETLNRFIHYGYVSYLTARVHRDKLTTHLDIPAEYRYGRGIIFAVRISVQKYQQYMR